MSLYRDDLMCDSLVTRTKCCHFMFLQTDDTLNFFSFHKYDTKARWLPNERKRRHHLEAVHHNHRIFLARRQDNFQPRLWLQKQVF